MGSENRLSSKSESFMVFLIDIVFSIILFFLVFCVSYGLNVVCKSWDSALLQLCLLLLISSATICSLIFVLQSSFEVFKGLRIARNNSSKT